MKSGDLIGSFCGYLVSSQGFGREAFGKLFEIVYLNLTNLKEAKNCNFKIYFKSFLAEYSFNYSFCFKSMI
jgi:hypothetical protein